MSKDNEIQMLKAELLQLQQRAKLQLFALNRESSSGEQGGVGRVKTHEFSS